MSNRIPKWMLKLGNRLPLKGKQSYIRISGSNWEVVDETGAIRYSGTRKHWAVSFAQKYWDRLG